MPIKKNKIVSEEELNQIYQEMCEKSERTGDENSNPYDIYIQERKLERELNKPDENQYFEKHHIIPRFEDGPNTVENIVRLTIKEHVIAHWLRWKVFGQSGDYSAFLFRIGDTEAAYALKLKSIQEARERDKKNGKGFSNSKFQSEQGRKGGLVAGSLNTEAQFQARSAVGTEFGRSTGLNNQSTRLKEFLSKHSLWAYRPTATETPRTREGGVEVFFFLEPKEAFSDLLNTLNSYVPGSIKTKASMYKLVYGERKQMNGWRIVFTLTRSEASKGIQEFQDKNPEVIITFEED